VHAGSVVTQQHVAYAEHDSHAVGVVATHMGENKMQAGRCGEGPLRSCYVEVPSHCGTGLDHARGGGS
jgi:hypothetical protein